MIRPVLVTLISFAAVPSAAQQTSPSDQITRTHGISIIGEPALPADFPHLPYVNPDAPKGGEISISAIGGFDSYNPYTHRGRAPALSVIQLESLMELGTGDEPLAAYCLICETLEYPESRDWVIFHLRPEARFADGTPLTAEDVKFSFETLRDKGLSSYRMAIQAMVSDVEVLGPQQIRFSFAPDYPKRDVIYQLGAQTVFSKKDFTDNDRDLEASSDSPFIGSGPYLFDSADIGRSITVRRNDEYWGKDLPINRGRHNFDRIRYEYFSDFDTAFEAFKAGEYTFRNETSSLHWATRYDFPAVRNGTVKLETLPDGTPASGTSWVFNLRREKFQDIRVREAINLMFNFEWTNKTLLYGLEKRVISFSENTDFGASGAPSDAEMALLGPVAADLPETALAAPREVQPGSSDSQLDRAQLRLAADLLEDAGWVTGADGMRRNAEGETLRVAFLNDDVGNNRIINPFVENLRRLGVDAVNERVDNAEMKLRERSHDFDIIQDDIALGLLIGGGTMQVFGSTGAGDVFNLSGLANPGVDALISHGMAVTDAEENRTALGALDRALRALTIRIPQWFKPEHTLAYYDQYEHPANMPEHVLGVLDFWWYNAEKAEKLRKAGALR